MRWNLGYRHKPAAYELARRAGVVKVVRGLGYGAGRRSTSNGT